MFLGNGEKKSHRELRPLDAQLESKDGSFALCHMIITLDVVDV